MAGRVLVIENNRRKWVALSELSGVNASYLDGTPATHYQKKGMKEDYIQHFPYRVQGTIFLNSIDYPMYVLDGGSSSLTLPSVVDRGIEAMFINVTKGVFTINGGGIKIVRSGVEYDSITLTEYQSIRLTYLDIGTDHPSMWYESISIPTGVGGYTHPATHPPSIIAQNSTNRFVTDTEKSTWNNKQNSLGFTPAAENHSHSYEPADSAIQTHIQSTHAPSTAQKNSDITKGEIEAKLIGAITSHSHSGGADPFMAKLILGADKPTGANITPVTLGLEFNYEANSKYVIDMYMIVAPTAATTGCGFLLDVSSAVTYVGLFTSHQLATTGTISGAGSIGDAGVTSQGVSSGMPVTGSNFVYGGGMLITGANTGTATFFFRSETTAVTTCKANSIIRVMKA